jgi:Nucleotidyl transferase of unknown function (DUF2204)
LNNDFRDILSGFIAEGVEFLLVGAYAMAVHGVPRATGDIDLWIRPSAENSRRVWKALAAFGAPVSDIRAEELATPGLVYQIGVAPRRIDVLTSIDGIEFPDAWPNRTEVQIEGLSIPVLGRGDLIRNKKAAGRAKDQADLALLAEAGDRGSSAGI